MMNLSKICVATLDELTDELGSAGWDNTIKCLWQAREDVVRLLWETLDARDENLYLYDSTTNNVICCATLQQTIDSVLAGPEGHILGDDGRTYYVAE